MRRMKYSKIFFLLMLFFTVSSSYAQLGGSTVPLKTLFSVNGFQLGEVYPEDVQKSRFQGARMNENETEFGIDRIFIYGSDEENNLTFFRFESNELREFFIMNKVFSFDIGRVKIKVGEPLDKLKNVPKLKMEQAINYRAKPKPQPIKGAWVLRHPDLHEEVFQITIYEENGIITALSGYILP